MKQFPLFSLFSKIVRKWPPKDAAYFLPTTTAVWLSTSMCECGWVNKNGRIFWESLRWQMWSPPRSGENKSFTWNRHQAEDWSTFWKIIQNGPFFLNALMVKLGGLLNKWQGEEKADWTVDIIWTLFFDQEASYEEIKARASSNFNKTISSQ